MSKKLHLHLDADTSSKALYNALWERGHDVTRTPNEWMPFDARDELQLLGATAQGRAIFTYNIRDVIVLGRHYPHYAGIILTRQGSMTLSEIINALDWVLRETGSDEWIGQTRWLNEWRKS